MDAINVSVLGLSAHVAAEFGVKQSVVEDIMQTKEWWLAHEAQIAISDTVHKLVKEYSDATQK